jgi:hypothetical protein
MNGDWHTWENLGKPGGWSHLVQIAVGRNLDGRQEAFAVDTDGALWQIWQTPPNNGWSHWETRGKPTVDGIALNSPAVGRSLVVRQQPDGRLTVFVIASRSLHSVQQTAPNNGWGDWQHLGQPPGSGGIVSLDAVQSRDGALQLFTIGYDGRMASRRQAEPGGDWGPWETDFPHDDRFPIKSLVAGQNADGRIEIIVNLNGNLALITQSEPGGAFRTGFGNAGISVSPDTIGPLVVARNPDGTLEAAMTIDGKLVHIRQHVPNQPPSQGGGGWARHDLGQPANHIAVSAPVLAVNREGGLEVFATGRDGNLWHRRQTTPGGAWSDWQSLGAPSDTGAGFASTAVGTNQDQRLEVFAVHQGALRNTWQVA